MFNTINWQRIFDLFIGPKGMAQAEVNHDIKPQIQWEYNPDDTWDPAKNLMEMRPEFLMIHCTATPEGMDFTKEQIDQWWASRGWKNPGYRQVTHLDGTIRVLQPYDSDDLLEPHEITNGAKGWNRKTIHLSYIGGIDSVNGLPKDTRTLEQIDSLLAQVKCYLYMYPWLKVIAHNQVSTKACPSFDVQRWLRTNNIPEINIYSAVERPGEFFDNEPRPESLLFDMDHSGLLKEANYEARSKGHK